MIPSNDKEKAFAIQLDAQNGSFFYFRTVSGWNGFGPKGRDKRLAEPVIVPNFQRICHLLGESFVWVRNDEEMKRWVGQFGWMLTPIDFARERLAALLSSHTCVKSPLGLFWDVELPRNRAASRRISKDVRQRILDRDGHKCTECGKGEADDVELTMDHVIPFARGGETTEGNLVTLCKSCNQEHGNEHHPHLFALAGLHHGWDPRLVKSASTGDSLHCAMTLSHNIMVSRCRVHEILVPTGSVGEDS